MSDHAARLSVEQIESFLRRARLALAKSDFITGSAKNTSSDFQTLELASHEDQVTAIRDVLNEISSDHYRGPDPPKHKSREPKCKGATMMQFVWNSACFGKQMCVKFCMVDERLAVLRIHEAYNPNQFEG